VRAGIAYPPFLITTSTEDNRVGPGHARKLAAMSQKCGAAVYFCEEEEGRGGRARRERSHPQTGPDSAADDVPDFRADGVRAREQLGTVPVRSIPGFRQPGWRIGRKAMPAPELAIAPAPTARQAASGMDMPQ